MNIVVIDHDKVAVYRYFVEAGFSSTCHLEDFLITKGHNVDNCNWIASKDVISFINFGMGSSSF